MSGRACRWSDVMCRAGPHVGPRSRGIFGRSGYLNGWPSMLLCCRVSLQGVDVGSYRETPKNAAARGFCLLGVLRRVCYS